MEAGGLGFGGLLRKHSCIMTFQQVDLCGWIAGEAVLTMVCHGGTVRFSGALGWLVPWRGNIESFGKASVNRGVSGLRHTTDALHPSAGMGSVHP